MEYHNRIIENKCKALSKLFPIIAVLGARQVGKSTLLNHLFGKKAKTFVFDPINDSFGARNDPELFLKEHKTPMILDEIQFAVELLPALKRKVDMNQENGIYYLTGSQNLSMMKNISESLAGRVGIIELAGMTIGELENKNIKTNWLSLWLQGLNAFKSKMPVRSSSNISLTERLWRGNMPGLLQFNNDEYIHDYFNSYTLTYIERDVRQAGNIKNLDSFRQFISLVSVLTAQEINLSQLGRELGITRITAREWLSILKSTYQWISFPPYHGNAIKRLSKHHKGYLHDTGLACFLQHISSPESLFISPALGKIFETNVATNIYKQIFTMPTKPACYHWRTLAGAEVDIILEIDGQLWPFECKCSSRITKHDARGILAFRKTYPKITKTPAAIIAPVDEPYPLAEDIWVLPYDLI